MNNKKYNDRKALDEELHAAEVESLEKRIMELALEQTGSRSGAIFLWDNDADGLAIDFHVVEGIFINLPDKIIRHRRDGRPNGIALWVLDNNEPYLCSDASRDPNYAPYFQDVLSIAAVPIPYQKRPIGVLSVSSREAGAYSARDVETLKALAVSSAKFLRRVQLYLARKSEGGHILLIKGLSREWLEVERQIEQASPTDAPVLVQGESGTGKELVANAIHFNSRRATLPFVTVNCAAIPDQLLESTLFGHMRGAFTGANFTKVGDFRKAAGGTLFLDEVGDLPLPLQPKILRAVEYGEVQPLGSNAPPASVDVRVICATNRDLADMVRRGLFREDLYYRISLVTMKLPPLRTYKHTLPVLSRIFLNQACKKHGKTMDAITAEAMATLTAYDFPGNMRELQHAMEHAVIMAAGREVGREDLPLPLRLHEGKGSAKPGKRPASGDTLRQLREACLAPVERQYLSDLLTQCGGNVRKAARRAGVNTVTFYRLMKKRGLRLTRGIHP
jgi:transcriptional regulator with GAF, ATPase, and Fis domain